MLLMKTSISWFRWMETIVDDREPGFTDVGMEVDIVFRLKNLRNG